MIDHKSPWERFVLFGEQDLNVRKPILDSWTRCREKGLAHDHHRILFSYLEDQDFTRKKRQNHLLFQAAIPVLEEMYNQLQGGGYQLVLADAEGVLMEVMADTKARSASEGLGISSGIKWMEEQIGTTGLSVAIKSRTPLATSGLEHYCTLFRAWDCAACPIFADGVFYGVFDICRVGVKDNLQELLSMAIAGAMAVGERIRHARTRMKEKTLSRIIFVIINN